MCASLAPSTQTYNGLYRPQFHFSPASNWMNDPSGLLHHNGIYHLFYQYNPNGRTWGAMSWGHATSLDLTHWEHQPIALLARGFPDNITEMFFTGSAVADVENTSGFGTEGKVPLVAIYTSHYLQQQTLPSGKLVRQNQQSQSIAYSLDDGITWTTYDAGNPVILDPPAQYAEERMDFRDPYVFWHSHTDSWIMVLALAKLHKLLVYTSRNLKDWTIVSEFGPVNAVGGVWECPNLFPLALDGDQSNMKWVMQIGLNPGGPPGTVGSGTQYVVGSFDGKTFFPDANSVYSEPTSLPKGSIIFADFEGKRTLLDLGWTAAGGLTGASLADGTLQRQLNEDSRTRTLTSPSFQISHQYINFRIGGGQHVNEISINLKVQGQIVRTATGVNGETLQWSGWDVSNLIGNNAVIELVDNSTASWGHVSNDKISFSNSLARSQKANWVDWGPDFYAAQSYNGLPQSERVNIGWMNNWQYGQVIPTSPWRSATAIPRKLALKTIDNKATLVQTPKVGWAAIDKTSADGFSRSWNSVPEGITALSGSGKALDISLSFSNREPSASSSNLAQFGIIVRASSDLREQTRVGYDFATMQVFIDRTKSGNVGFDSTFASVYYGPLCPTKDGNVTLRILVDWSSVEVFGGQGEATITAQIFPSVDANLSQLFSTGGRTENVQISMRKTTSVWNEK